MPVKTRLTDSRGLFLKVFQPERKPRHLWVWTGRRRKWQLQAEKESVLESMDPMVMAVGGVAVAYVDGSYNVATGEYGAGVAFFSEQGEEHISRKGEDKELASMRNVAGEILGSRLAMEKAVALKQKKIYKQRGNQAV